MNNIYIVCKLDFSSTRWKTLGHFNKLGYCVKFVEDKILKDHGVTIDKLNLIDKFCYQYKDTQYYIVETNKENAKFFGKIFGNV